MIFFCLVSDEFTIKLLVILYISHAIGGVMNPQYVYGSVLSDLLTFFCVVHFPSFFRTSFSRQLKA